MSAIGVELEAFENVRLRSSTVPALYIASCVELVVEMIGSRGRGFSEKTDEGNSYDVLGSESKDGSRGVSVSTSTRGGARPTEETVVAVVSALPRLAELEDMPKRRVMLGLLASKGDRRGFSGVVLSDMGVRGRAEIEEAVYESEEGISMGSSFVSPKLIRSAISPIALDAGGVANSSSRRSTSSLNTLPGMLSDGPSESMRARIVMRFVL